MHSEEDSLVYLRKQVELRDIPANSKCHLLIAVILAPTELQIARQVEARLPFCPSNPSMESVKMECR